MAELIQRFVAGSPPAEHGLRGVVRQGRRESIVYHLHRPKWFLGRRHRGLRLLTYALPSIPPGPLRTFAEMGLLVAAGKADDAAAALQNISDHTLLKMFQPLWCWQYFRDSHFLAGERRLAPLLNAAMPRIPFVRLHAVNSYITLGEREAASRELDEILTLDGIEPLRSQVAILAGWLGRPDTRADLP